MAELGLLLKQIGGGRASGFFLQGQMHTLVAAVLLRMTGPDAFDGARRPYRYANQLPE